MPIRLFVKISHFQFQIANSYENQVFTKAFQFPTITKSYVFTKFLRLSIGKYLFKKYVRDNGFPNVVHVHSFDVGDLAIWIKKKYGIPYVITEHSTGFARNLYSERDLKYAQKVYQNSATNIAVSSEFKNLLTDKFNCDFVYIPNLVDSNYFKPISDKKKNGRFTFLNVAYLDKKKNHEMLIKAFSKAFKTDKTVQLIIAGDGQERKNLEKLILSEKLDDQVHLFGLANKEQVLELMQNSDRFVLSSEFETFGIVIIEAMSCRLPIIATKCGGPESILTDEKLGELCEINIDSLKQAIERSYRKSYNKDLIREHVIDNFSVDAVTKKLNKIYKSILE
ncbi:glycosyltransferase [Fulvivirgaceae bacterium BMA10]|uniref:Glycosyltransferase n=2 Tax=Splendidivirga corallicola TaxID=3051826 RepID=A0ABT8KMH3_9BACT|nr:glycosyltransferase [Fulvivirgaceae bacterium BMA10]